MLNPSDSSLELKKYLKKLLRLIEYEATFTFFKTKLIDKSRADDIICCIEASFPKEYKEFVKRTGGKKLRSNFLWIQVLEAVRNKFCFSTCVYSVRTAAAIQAITSMGSVIDSDMRIIYNEASNMF